MKSAILLLLPLTLASCRRGEADSTWWRNETKLIELRNQLELTRFRAAQQPGSRENKDSSPTFGSPESLRGEITSILGEKRSLIREIDEMRSGWDAFRVSILQERRYKASGITFDEFKCLDGRTFRDVRVTRIDDIGISLTHSHGTIRLRFGDLDPASQAFFGLDGELAGEAILAETEKRIAYERTMERQLAVISKNEEKLRKERQEEEARLASSRLLAAARQTPAASPLSSSIGALGETSSVYGKSRRYSSFSSYYRRPVTRYNYVYTCRSSPSGIPFFRTNQPHTGYCPRPPFQYTPPAPIYNR